MRFVTSPESGKSGNNIRVAVRCRPPNKRELALQESQRKASANAKENQSAANRTPAVVVSVPGGEPTVGRVEVWGGGQPFQFDIAFPMESTQRDVFENVGVGIVKCAYHGCAFFLLAPTVR